MKELVIKTAIWAVLTDIFYSIIMVIIGEMTIDEALSLQFVWQLLIFFVCGLICFYLLDRYRRRKKS